MCRHLRCQLKVKLRFFLYLLRSTKSCIYCQWNYCVDTDRTGKVGGPPPLLLPPRSPPPSPHPLLMKGRKFLRQCVWDRGRKQERPFYFEKGRRLKGTILIGLYGSVVRENCFCPPYGTGNILKPNNNALAYTVQYTYCSSSDGKALPCSLLPRCII